MGSLPYRVVDPSIVLPYLTADYFFVNKRNPRLVEEIRHGLKIELAEGSFDKLFFRFYSNAIVRAQLDKRMVIDLANPTLGSDTPLARKE